MKRLFAFMMAAIMLFSLSACDLLRLDDIIEEKVEEKLQEKNILPVPDISSDGTEEYLFGDFTYNAKDITKIEVSWAAGSVELIHSDAEVLSVNEIVDQQLLKEKDYMHYAIYGSTMKIFYCKDSISLDWKNTIGSKSLYLELPKDISIEINSAAADVTAEILALRDLEIKSASGDVSIAELTAKEISVNGVSGDTELTKAIATEEMDVASVSGRISVDEFSAESASFSTVSGRIGIGFASCRELEAESVSGDIEITLPQDGSAAVHFSTVSGQMHSERDRAQSGAGSGEAKCSIEVETVSGDLTIR